MAVICGRLPNSREAKTLEIKHCSVNPSHIVDPLSPYSNTRDHSIIMNWTTGHKNDVAIKFFRVTITLRNSCVVLPLNL